jgi:hypothetical protein
MRATQFVGGKVDQEASCPRRHVVSAFPVGRARICWIALPAGPQLGIAGLDFFVGQTFPAPVVELTESLVDLDRPSGGNGLGRLERPKHGTRDDAIDPDASQAIPERLGLRAPFRRQRHVELPAEHDVARSGDAVASQDEGQHRSEVYWVGMLVARIGSPRGHATVGPALRPGRSLLAPGLNAAVLCDRSHRSISSGATKDQEADHEHSCPD